MRFDILTIFPEMFEQVFEASLLGKAREKGLLEVNVHDMRQWGVGPHDSVDDRPYGGGPGMVIKPEPVINGVEEITEDRQEKPELILLSPRGKQLQQKMVHEYANQEQDVLLICGHYEGFDERIRDLLEPREISIGDYVLSGGEIPAMVVVDAVSRLVPGVVGDPESVQQESFTRPRLDYPQYTRPEQFRGLEVPDVLLSGHHQKIEEWRRKKAREITLNRRPDLLEDSGDEESEENRR